MSFFKKRIRDAWRWRLGKLKNYYARITAQMGSKWFVALHWPWPLRKPYQRKRLTLTPPGGGIGDELVCTPILREIKQRNPKCHITFLSRYPQLFTGFPHIDELIPYNPDLAAKAIRLAYDHVCPMFKGVAKGKPPVSHGSKDLSGRSLHANYTHAYPPPRPLISLMAEWVGLQFFSTKLFCSVPPATNFIREFADEIQHPLIVIQTVASQWTPNKNWPADHWRELIAMLTKLGTVVETGTESCLPKEFQLAQFRSLVGKTNLDEFLYIISKADVFVGPVSGGMHIAHAYQKPSVIIYGGYESPDGYKYSRVMPLYSVIHCAPCWLTTPCPYGLECLKRIVPQQVFDAVKNCLHFQC